MLNHRMIGFVRLGLSVLLLIVSFCQLQGQETQSTVSSDTLERKIYLLHANTLTFDKRTHAERQILKGDVRFRQDSAYMYCDSAYFYEKSNSMEAFGRVRMEQGDTLFLFADSLAYDGNTAIARCMDQVRLIHNNTILYTDYLLYDRLLAEAHYPETGFIVDSINHLSSESGWYYPNEREALFMYDVQLRNYDYSDSVILENRVLPLTGNNPKLDSLLQLIQPPHAEFRPDDAVLPPQVIAYSDTLRHSFLYNQASLTGPSRICNDSSTVYTTRGIFNTQTSVAQLYERSSLVSPGRFATGDTLCYDAQTGVGDAWGRIVVCDTVQHMKLMGDYMHYVELPQNVMVTGRALAMEFSDKDTLYLHADTLRAFSVLHDTIRKVSRQWYDTLSVSQVLSSLPDSLMTTDSLVSVNITEASNADSLVMRSVTSPGSDTLLTTSQSDAPLTAPQVLMRDTVIEELYVDTLRYMLAYNNVRYYRTDLQGVCDSLHYSLNDSLATFIGNPVMWNDVYQITGDTIFAVATQGGIQQMMVHDHAFLVQQKDTVHYDQISGKNLICYFDSSRVKQMDMSGNVQIIYYPEESDKTLIGLNQVIGNYMTVWFVDNKMEHLRVWPDVVGSLTPLPLITEDILYLENFRWMQYLRPTDPMDVFRDVRMKATDIQENKMLFDLDELYGY